jgi:hypothetical protein
MLFLLCSGSQDGAAMTVMVKSASARRADVEERIVADLWRVLGIDVGE